MAGAFTGGDPFSSLVVVGGIARLTTLYFTFVCERIAARYACALPELHAATADFDKLSAAPYLLKLEYDMALKKLTRDRTRILKKHGGNIEHMFWVSLISPALLSLWAVGPARAMLAQLPGGDGAVAACPLLVKFGADGAQVVLDPSYALFAAVAGVNATLSMRMLLGFSDKGDETIHRRWKLIVASATAGGALATLCSTAIASSWIVLPAALAQVTAQMYCFLPFSLGVSFTTLLLKQPLLHFHSLRLILDIPDKPATHGTYGNKSTGFQAEAQKAYEDIRGETTPAKYEVYIEELEKDCDRRIRKSLSKYFGIFGAEDDYWSALSENERRLGAMRAQKFHRDDTSSNGVRTSDGEQHPPPS